MDALLATFAKWVLAVLGVGGTSAAFAYALFKWLGQNWLERRFKTQLENLKHEQQKEIEQLRYSIQSSFSRISKVHDKEFEVLPRSWFLLHDAYGKAFKVMSALQQFPDLKNLPESRFHEFVKECGLSDSVKQELRLLHAEERDRYYRDAIAWIELRNAQAAQATFHNYLVEHRIFMTEELREKFGGVDTELSSSLIEHEIWKQSGDRLIREAGQRRIASLADKIAPVERAVQQRLEYGQA